MAKSPTTSARAPNGAAAFQKSIQGLLDAYPAASQEAIWKWASPKVSATVKEAAKALRMADRQASRGSASTRGSQKATGRKQAATQASGTRRATTAGRGRRAATTAQAASPSTTTQATSAA